MTNTACIALLTAALALASGCETRESPVRLVYANVVYDGPPYGDFLVLADAVRECMHSDATELPHLVLVDREVKCFTAEGWQWVYGCEGEGGIVLVASKVLESKGALWSHELAHYFGSVGEGSLCGGLFLDEFSLDAPDAG